MFKGRAADRFNHLTCQHRHDESWRDANVALTEMTQMKGLSLNQGESTTLQFEYSELSISKNNFSKWKENVSWSPWCRVASCCSSSCELLFGLQRNMYITETANTHTFLVPGSAVSQQSHAALSAHQTHIQLNARNTTQIYLQTNLDAKTARTVLCEEDGKMWGSWLLGLMGCNNMES